MAAAMRKRGSWILAAIDGHPSLADTPQRNGLIVQYSKRVPNEPFHTSWRPTSLVPVAGHFAELDRKVARTRLGGPFGNLGYISSNRFGSVPNLLAASNSAGSSEGGCRPIREFFPNMATTYPAGTGALLVA